MKRSILIVVIFASTLQIISAIDMDIECSYKLNQRIWNAIETNFTICDLQTDMAFSLGIREVTGLPLSISKEDVRVFNVKNKFFIQLPFGLNVAFPNLVGIKIDSTNFKYLQPNEINDLNLKYFAITKSSLSVIFKDTFNNHTALELLDLTGNYLHFVSISAFNNMKNLKFLYFETYGCSDKISFYGSVNSTSIDILKKKITENCNDQDSLLWSFEHTIYDLLKWFGHTEYYKCSYIEDFNETLNRLEQCKLSNEALNDEIFMLNQKIENVDDKTCYPSGTCIFTKISNAYSCVAKLYVKAAFEQNINWTGIHVSSLNNDAVMSVVIQSQIMEVFPTNIGSTFKNLKNLSIRNSGLTRIRANDFKNLSKLENLEIIGNNIALFDATAFSGLNLLKKIDLSSNNITVLPSLIFEPLLSLEIINLSNNKLKQLRFDIISNGNAIQEIYLSNNAITPLDRTFIWRLQQAVKIDLSGTGCPYSFDKDASPEVPFYDFYTNIIMHC